MFIFLFLKIQTPNTSGLIFLIVVQSFSICLKNFKLILISFIFLTAIEDSHQEWLYIFLAFLVHKACKLILCLLFLLFFSLSFWKSRRVYPRETNQWRPYGDCLPVSLRSIGNRRGITRTRLTIMTSSKGAYSQKTLLG